MLTAALCLACAIMPLHSAWSQDTPPPSEKAPQVGLDAPVPAPAPEQGAPQTPDLQQAAERPPGEPEAAKAPPTKTQPPPRARSTRQKAHAKVKGGLIEMNFKNVDIINFLQIMSKTLGVAMVWNESQIRGNITLVSSKKFSRQDALRIFETVLSMQGYTTIRTQGSPVLQIVPTKDAPRMPSPTRTDGRQGKNASFFITQIVPLRYADANQIKAALTPLVSRTAGLAVYAPANVLVVSDTETNVKRLVSIIKEMDVPPEDIEFAVITLKYASSRKIAPILTTLASVFPVTTGAQPKAPAARGRPTGQARLKVVAEERTNALILVGDPAALAKFREIINQLDVPGAVQEQGVKVFRLEFADAEELVKILKDVKLRPPTTPGAPPQPGRPAARGVSVLPEVTLTADKATNSLIMFGPEETIKTMGQMVSQLDVRRPQVYVEVLIMEMTLEKSLELGVRWQGTSKVTDGVVGLGTPDATPRTLENALVTGSGSAIGIVGDEITFAGQKFTSFSGFVQATQQDQDVNVLANPQILTLNNQEAEINVSQVVPVSTRTVTNNQLQTTTEFEFKDVGIILKITPQITGSDKVRLLLNQESSSIAARQEISSGNQRAVTTLKRKINTQVVVDDNTTMAIGGLIQDQEVKTETKTPCLGDIPVVGWLFKSTADQLRKTNLIVFIRPRIVYTREDMIQATDRVEQRYQRMRNPKADAESTLRESFGLPSRPPANSEKPAQKGKQP